MGSGRARRRRRPGTGCPGCTAGSGSQPAAGRAARSRVRPARRRSGRRRAGGRPGRATSAVSQAASAPWASRASPGGVIAGERTVPDRVRNAAAPSQTAGVSGVPCSRSQRSCDPLIRLPCPIPRRHVLPRWPAKARQPPADAAWSAFGAGTRPDHPGGAGIIEPNEQLIFSPFPCHRHPASGHPLRDLPAHRGLPARRSQRGADRALPPGPSRSARPSRPVRSAARRITPLVPSPAPAFP